MILFSATAIDPSFSLLSLVEESSIKFTGHERSSFDKQIERKVDVKKSDNRR